MQQPEEANPVDTICRLAKDRKLEELRSFAKGKSLDCNYGRYNAMYRLAKEGTLQADQAVDLLHENFHTNLNWALMGAAAGGNDHLIRKLLARGAMINYAMYGAGQRGDRPLINWLKARGGDVFWGVVGAAGSTNQDLYLELNEEGKNINKNLKKERNPTGGELLVGAGIIDNPALLEQSLDSDARDLTLIHTIAAAAQNGNRLLLRELLQNFAFHDRGFRGTKVLFLAMGAYAGHQDDIIKEYMRREDQTLYAAQGAGYGGHRDLIEDLLKKAPGKRDAILNFAAHGAALKGDISLVAILWAQGAQVFPSDLLTDSSILKIAEGGHIELLNSVKKVISEEAARDPKLYSDLINALKKQGFINGNEEDVLRVASFIDDARLREMYIAQAHVINNQLKPKYLFRKATILNGIMNRFDINYNQALAWNNPAIRTWLMRTEERTDKLPREIMNYIASFAASLTDDETAELVVKLREAKQNKTFAPTFKLSEPGKEPSQEEPKQPEQKQEGPKPR